MTAEIPMKRRRVVIVGNPNVGKSTIFNEIIGGNSRISNYPGITAESLVGEATVAGEVMQFTDLPGTYSLDLELPDSLLCKMELRGETEVDFIIVVIDAIGLRRSVQLISELMSLGVPMAAVLTKGNEAKLRGYQVQVDALEKVLGIPTVEVEERGAVRSLDIGTLIEKATVPDPVEQGNGDDVAPAIQQWGTDLLATVSRPLHPEEARKRRDREDRIDGLAIHPLIGLVIFLAAMGILFGTVFWLAQMPMEWIDMLFGQLASWTAENLDEGPVRGLLVDGIIGGIGGTLIFLPQILMLFFLVSLLEETGYLARAAFVADRWLRPFGLPGQAFVPLLSSHACAIPGILCTRLIPDRRDRLATIFVAPFLSCSARLPVYILLVGVLFPGRPIAAGFAFVGCYLLGAVVAVLSAVLVRRTLLPGRSSPMVLELPPYQRPSFREAGRVALHRGWTFLTNAGSAILCICILLWWLSSYPGVEPSVQLTSLQQQASQMEDPVRAEQLAQEAELLSLRESARGSYAGQLGRWVEPVLAPVGADWQLSVAVMASFAAREVFVSSLNVMIGVGEDSHHRSTRERVVASRRDDGSPLLPASSAAGLLVFYVLAMQCLPTLAVTRKEAGGIHWALLQLAWMTAVAWILGTLTRLGLLALGVS